MIEMTTLKIWTVPSLGDSFHSLRHNQENMKFSD